MNTKNDIKMKNRMCTFILKESSECRNTKICMQSERKLNKEIVNPAQEYGRYQHSVLCTIFDSQDSPDEHRQDVRIYEMSQSMRTDKGGFFNEMEKL